MKNSVKAAIIAVIVGVGIYATASMEDRVNAALKEVTTIKMSRTAFRKSVSARGSLYSENDVWYVAAAVDESDIGEVAVGQPVAVTGAIKLGEGGDYLKNGYSAQGSIFVDEAKLLNTLPYDVIRQDDAGEYVYVYDNNKAVMKRIETGVELSDETEIVRGISEQSEVIAMPDEVTDNALVRKE